MNMVQRLQQNKNEVSFLVKDSVYYVLWIEIGYVY